MNQNNYTELRTFGYTLIKNIVGEKHLGEIRNQLENQAREEIAENSVFRNREDQIILRNVFVKSPNLFLPLLDMEPVVSILKSVFDEEYILQSMNASRANPIKKDAIPVKVDLDSILPSKGVHIDSRLAAKGIEHTLSLGIAFCIDDFTIENGATKVWPFSHLVGLKPDEAIKMGLSIPAPVLIEAKGGDLLVFLSHLWHTVGSNNTANPRWGIFTFFSPWWMKPTWDYRDCGEEMFAKLSNHQKQLFGFTSQVPSILSKRTLTKTQIGDLPEKYQDARKID